MEVYMRSIKIQGLHDSKTVSIHFNNAINIFVGENGVGKTTVLNILYYLLSGNYIELKKINFTTISIGFDEQEIIEFSKDEVLDYIDSPYEDEIYLKYLSWEFRNLDFSSVLKAKSIRGDDIVFKRWARDIDKSIIAEVKNSTNFKDLNLRELHSKNRDTSKMPYNYFVYCIATIYDNSHISHSSISEYVNPFKTFVSRIEAFKKDKKILYFPTYRRIEEEIFANNDITNLPFREEIKENLINFGMEDVKKQIDNILYGIKTVTSQNYEQMTTGLLNEYTTDDDFEFSELEKSDPETIRIALSRLGSKVEKRTIDIIIDKFKKDSFSKDKDKYLMNLLNKILENYSKLSDIDNRIKRFVDVVNKYFINKEFVYNQSSLDIAIYSREKKKIELNQLSSGEKQLVSIFSKVLLEDKEIIVLFDEPELSLSIEWQKEFLVDISNSNSLFFLVAVTHSPFIFENLFDNVSDFEVFSGDKNYDEE
ncbi:hypothetical protein B7702_07005 [Streptococcus mitis]|jgi:hypothetical protein|uniref:Endonuclease GajA/Old nuclease/RecF-like AAA domain-containing protein n=3 Tax=Streptococcus mitis TaxID=28037 RepID=A0A1X1JLY0_STRMT|nr:hypothetical protein B7702_07005 [Streptococcus mitis]